METNNTTFWRLIKSYRINIPIIQRDYAQGREEESEKREKFLSVIHNHLKNGIKLHLDFVYGRLRDSVFYPIDGQQRLTTLFLLHWYFALKEGIPEDQKAVLGKFEYDTRISSREFCQFLVKEEIEIPTTIEKDNFIKYIKNKYWYRNKWNSDPTVQAMLIMIQALHEKFYHFNCSSVFKQLMDGNSISFEVLDLGAKGFELTDELYIKMNARGKQLTSFENFKANFIQFIDRNFKGKMLDHPIKGKVSYSGYFAYKIEKEWTDLFWDFRGNRNTTDTGFSNFFHFFLQMLYFKKYKEAKADDFKNTFRQYEDIYLEEGNLLFLFSSLDKMYEIFHQNGQAGRRNLDHFFDDIGGAVSLFWNKSGENNLFEKVVLDSENEDARNKIILFSVLHYMVKHSLTATNEELKNYVRVVRNLVQATRQRNETRYNTNIRINTFGNYWILFEQLATNDVYHSIQSPTLNNKDSQISGSSINNEIEKARILQLKDNTINEALTGIEELRIFQGLIHQLMPQLNQKKFPEYLRSFKEIWSDSISDTLKIQALISCGFKGLKIKDTKMGPTYFFGRNGNWTIILTNDDAEISESIITLLETYSTSTYSSPEAKLQAIVEDWFVENHKDRSYEYYFLKYPEFTSKSNYFVKPYDYRIRILGAEGSNPLNAYHISPFALTVCKLINDETLCDERQSYQQYSGYSPLVLYNGIAMTPVENGWIISSDCSFSDSVVEKYGFSPVHEQQVLTECEQRDRIEIAVDFINDVLNCELVN